MAFKLRSGNTTPFKSMGSSPVKQTLRGVPSQIDDDTVYVKGITNIKDVSERNITADSDKETYSQDFDSYTATEDAKGVTTVYDREKDRDGKYESSSHGGFYEKPSKANKWQGVFDTEVEDSTKLVTKDDIKQDKKAKIGAARTKFKDEKSRLKESGELTKDAKRNLKKLKQSEIKAAKEEAKQRKPRSSIEFYENDPDAYRKHIVDTGMVPKDSDADIYTRPELRGSFLPEIKIKG